MKEKIKELLLNPSEVNTILGQQLLTSLGYSVNLTKEEYSVLYNDIIELLDMDLDFDEEERYSFGDIVLERDKSYYNNSYDWCINIFADCCCDYLEDDELISCEGTKEIIEVFGVKSKTDIVMLVRIINYSDQAGGMYSYNYRSKSKSHLVFNSEEYANLYVKNLVV